MYSIMPVCLEYLHRAWHDAACTECGPLILCATSIRTGAARSACPAPGGGWQGTPWLGPAESLSKDAADIQRHRLVASHMRTGSRSAETSGTKWNNQLALGAVVAVPYCRGQSGKGRPGRVSPLLLLSVSSAARRGLTCVGGCRRGGGGGGTACECRVPPCSASGSRLHPGWLTASFTGDTVLPRHDDEVEAEPSQAGEGSF